MFLIAAISLPLILTSFSLLDSSFCPIELIENSESENGEEQESEEKESKENSEEYAFINQSGFGLLTLKDSSGTNVVALLAQACLEVVIPPPEQI
jgi:hypothetical protein